MNYYYDLFLNFSEDNLMFYEWDEKDQLEYYKKIPLFQVSTKSLKDFINNNIKVNKDFLKLIEDKAKSNNQAKYVAIFADKNGAIAIEFNELGKSIARSFLDINDEINLLDVLYTLRLEKIEYETLNEISYKDNLRLEDKIKLLINTEVNTLNKKQEYSKLRYLYMEWFSQIPSDNNKMIEQMKNKLKEKISENELKIYNLIKLSYSKV